MNSHQNHQKISPDNIDDNLDLETKKKIIKLKKKYLRELKIFDTLIVHYQSPKNNRHQISHTLNNNHEVYANQDSNSYSHDYNVHNDNEDLHIEEEEDQDEFDKVNEIHENNQDSAPDNYLLKEDEVDLQSVNEVHQDQPEIIFNQNLENFCDDVNRNELNESIGQKDNSADNSYTLPTDSKKILKKIFTYYASLGEPLNKTHLKITKLQKLLKDAGIMDENFNKHNLVYTFTQENKHKTNMDFDTFTSMLATIGKNKYPTENKNKAFLTIFTKFIFPLFLKMYHQTDLCEKDKKFGERMENITVKLLQSISGVFSKLHKLSFPTEFFTDSQKHQKKLEHSLVVFLRDFDIIPDLIDRTTAFHLFHEILDTPLTKLTNNPHFEGISIIENDQGSIFTLSRFLIFLARIAMIYGSTKDLANEQSLLWMLEKMQQTGGFLAFEKKVHANNFESIALVPSDMILHKLLGTTIHSLRNEENFSPLPDPKSRRNPRMSRDSSLTSLSCYSQAFLSPDKSNQSFDLYGRNSNAKKNKEGELKLEESLHEQNKDIMQRIFRAYSSYDSASKIYKLKTSKLIKILNHAKILKDKPNGSPRGKSPNDKIIRKTFNKNEPNLLSLSDFDLILVKLKGLTAKKPTEGHGSLSPEKSKQFKNPQPKLDFEDFNIVMQLVAHNVYPNHEEDEALLNLIQNHLVLINPKLNSAFKLVRLKLNHVKKFRDILKKEPMNDIMPHLKTSLYPYYSFYCLEGKEMNFDQFCRFCKDFSIFPKVLSRLTLMQLFYNLVRLNGPISDIVNQDDNVDTNRNKRVSFDIGGTIDEETFAEAIALCAINIETTSNNLIANIIYLLELMANSNGPNVVHKNERTAKIKSTTTFEVLGYIQTKYPGVMQAEILAQEKNKRNNSDNTKGLSNNLMNYLSTILDKGSTKYSDNESPVKRANDIE